MQVELCHQENRALRAELDELRVPRRLEALEQGLQSLSETVMPAIQAAEILEVVGTRGWGEGLAWGGWLVPRQGGTVGALPMATAPAVGTGMSGCWAGP